MTGVFRRYHVGNNPVKYRDPLGLTSIPSAEGLFGEIVGEIFGLGVENTIGGITGALCASNYCKRRASPGEWYQAASECMSIFNKHNLPPGPIEGGLSDDYVQSCASECLRITKKPEFNKICKCK